MLIGRHGLRGEALLPLNTTECELQFHGSLGIFLRIRESLKKLDDDPGSAGTRRKVGGLPAGQSIFELGVAGKGRIYYAKGRQRRFRVLAVGGKASQKPDLEYLSRVSLD